MKKKSRRVLLTPNGILRLSTLCIFAVLAGCDTYVPTEEDKRIAESQAQIEQLDRGRDKLINGEISNNFFLPQLGYYHAEAHDFFENPYGFEKDGKFFVNGQWQDSEPPEVALATRPTPEALKKIELSLAEDERLADTQPSYHHNSGNSLMMYWLLYGNRYNYAPGIAYQQAGSRISGWEQNLATQRSEVSTHIALNPGYRGVVSESRTSAGVMRGGGSARGGFGSSHGSSAS